MVALVASSDRRWAALIVLCAAMLMIVLDGTVVNVALPSIQSDLGFTASNLAWVINAYLIAFGGLLLLAGRLGDLIGSKRVFIAGLTLFTAASLLCGLSGQRDLLVGARFLQGIGGAFASSVVLAMIVQMFTEPAERARAMGVFSFTASAGGSIGLLVGGSLTQIASWHWVFLINVPIGIATIAFAVRELAPGAGAGLRAGADALGALLITAALMLLVYTVVELPDHGLTSPVTLATGVLGVALFAAFVVRQATATLPLMPLTIFRSRNISGSNVLQVLIVAAMYGYFFLDSLYFRRTLGYSAAGTGLAFLPVTLAIGILSLGWSAQIAMRFGPRNVIVVGVAIAACGLAISAVLPQTTNYLAFLPTMLLIGTGMGVSFPPLMLVAMDDATAEGSGLVSGIINTGSQVGGAFGLAILATLAAVTSYAFAFGSAAVCLALGSVIALTVLRPDAPHPESAR